MSRVNGRCWRRWAASAHDESKVGAAVRLEFTAHLTRVGTNVGAGDGVHAAHGELHSGAIIAAREAVLAMRANDEIGDDAFHVIEEELDWREMAGRHRPSGARA